MKNILKKVILTTLCLGGTLAVSGCDLSTLFANKERTVNDAVDGAKDTLVVSSDGYFRKEKVFNANGSGQSYVLTFDTTGGLKIKDLSDDSVVEYDYKVYDNLIETKTKGENPEINYIDYCDDILFIPRYTPYADADNRKSFAGGMCAVLEGVVASERQSTTIGWHTELSFRVGDLPAKLTGKKGSNGFCYSIKKNGTWKEKTDTADKYLSADAIASDDFDTSQVGTKLVNVTINSKTYKAVFRVWDSIESADD